MHHHLSLRSVRSAFLAARSTATPKSAIELSVASRSAVAQHLRGGDLVDMVDRDDGSSTLLIADISSKGRPSIDDAAALRREFRRVALRTGCPAAILSGLNDVKFEPVASLSWTFASAFIATMDRVTPQFRYASAGHEPALIIRGRMHRHLETTGPVLGIVREPSYATSEARLEADELLIVVSDGFLECRNAGLAAMRFGTTGIVRALGFDRIRSTRSAAQIIASAADMFSGSLYHDDATVAVVRRASRGKGR